MVEIVKYLHFKLENGKMFSEGESFTTHGGSKSIVQ